MLSLSAGPSESVIRVQLASEDYEEVTSGGELGAENLTPSGLITALLDIEDTQ